MKSLVLLVSTVIAFSAFAGEYSKPASVYFQSASTWVPATKVCRDGNVLKHVSKAAVQVEYCDQNDNNCYTVSKALSQPVISTAQRCAQYTDNDGDCAVWETYTLNQSTVNMYTYSNSEDDNGTLSGKYTIPACKTGGGVAN